jgi:hypothetical protein
VLASLIFVCSTPLSDAAEAQDFHVGNKVFFPETPPATSTTLFSAGRVYDFLEAAGGTIMETVVFDKRNDLIILLDPNRQMRTEISTGEVSTQMGRLREAAKQPNLPESIRFSANPVFGERVDPDTGKLVLDGKWMQYVVTTEAPKNPFTAKQYNEFADWLAQTNSLLSPPNMPFPRLKLNEVLKQRQEIPTEIELTIKPEGRRKPYVVRSEHNIQWALSSKDKQRIDEVGEQLHKFNLVTFEEYHKPPAPQGKQAAK